jgi:hypothetical protein
LLAKSALPLAAPPPPPPPVVVVVCGPPPPPPPLAVVVEVVAGADWVGTEPDTFCGTGDTVRSPPQPARMSAAVTRITGRRRISGRVYVKALTSSRR